MIAVVPTSVSLIEGDDLPAPILSQFLKGPGESEGEAPLDGKLSRMRVSYGLGQEVTKGERALLTPSGPESQR